ncbi:MAG: hypothetical protein ACKPKO_44815, partial [Candidatus Fonsibacter sp.]
TIHLYYESDHYEALKPDEDEPCYTAVEYSLNTSTERWRGGVPPFRQSPCGQQNLQHGTDTAEEEDSGEESAFGGHTDCEEVRSVVSVMTQRSSRSVRYNHLSVKPPVGQLTKFSK